MKGRELQIIVAILLLTCGMLVSATINHGTNDTDLVAISDIPPGSPILRFERSPRRLAISGIGASAVHEAGLRQIAAERLSGIELHADFRAGLLLPDHWVQTSVRLLHTIVAMEFAHARVSEHTIGIRGITSDAAALNARLDALRASLPDGIAVETDIVDTASTAALQSLCRRNLEHALSEPVAFRQSSAELRSSTFALLDRIVGLASECRQYSVVVTGHTDTTGDEAWNRLLSRARAQAVADYLVTRGISPDRLLVKGAGSLQPIADNATAHGRSRNRRIEFELR